MSGLILSLLILVMPSIAMAQNMPVQETAQFDAVIQTILLDTGKVTDVTAGCSSGTIAGAFAVEVYNISSTATVNCGFSPSVSNSSMTAAGLAWYGREITPKTGVYFGIRQTAGSPAKKVYCKPQAVDGGTGLTITQVK